MGDCDGVLVIPQGILGIRQVASFDEQEALNHVNPYSRPSDLRITDLRFVDIAGAPFRGFTFLKMDVGASLLFDVEGALSAPLGALDRFKAAWRASERMQDAVPTSSAARRRHDEVLNVPHPLTGIQLTEKGLDLLEQYVAEVRAVIGDEVPLAIDHMGHLNIESIIRLGRRLEKYHPAWLEDPVPWQYTSQYVRLSRAVSIPVCTGEDIYLEESSHPLLESGGVSVIHPDVLTAGGILETKKIADMAAEYGVPVALHMAESPIGCMAAAHMGAATENFLALEFHAADIPWWSDLAVGLPDPLIRDGCIYPTDKPGLGIDDLNDEVLAEHVHPGICGLWEATDAWNEGWAHDRTWS